MMISRSKIDRYREDPKLQKILSERRAAFVEAAVTKMQAALSESAEILEKIIKNESVAPQTRINAISILFSQCKNWTETAQMVDINELIAECYFDLHDDIAQERHQFYNLPGGRGSGNPIFINSNN